MAYNGEHYVELTGEQIEQVFERYRAGIYTFEELIHHVIEHQMEPEMSYNDRIELLGAMACTLWCCYKDLEEGEVPPSLVKVTRNRGGSFKMREKRD